MIDHISMDKLEGAAYSNVQPATIGFTLSLQISYEHTILCIARVLTYLVAYSCIIGIGIILKGIIAKYSTIGWSCSYSQGIDSKGCIGATIDISSHCSRSRCRVIQSRCIMKQRIIPSCSIIVSTSIIEQGTISGCRIIKTDSIIS